MEDANEFTEYYRPILLSYLDAENITLGARRKPLLFIEEVLSSWSNFAKCRILKEPSPEERTFWFALYQLEDLIEFPLSKHIDPYEEILMQNLVEVRELLRERGALPNGLYASRPGE